MTANPLRGPNPPELGGPRFLDLSGEFFGEGGGGRTGGAHGLPSNQTRAAGTAPPSVVLRARLQLGRRRVPCARAQPTG
jgi:hypothetical protein